jgi:hypothetical protein
MKYADLVSEVYYVYNDDKEIQTIGDYVPMLSADKYAVFVNDHTKEMVYAIRGISLNNKDDLITLTHDIIPQYQGGVRGGFKHIGNTIEEDMYEVENVYKNHKKEYPEYNHVFSGHSRGAGIALALGRKNNEVTHAYAPISSKVKGRYFEHADYDPENINIYYTAFDIAPKYLREEAQNSFENHNLVPLKKGVKEWFVSKGHSIDHFIEPKKDNYKQTVELVPEKNPKIEPKKNKVKIIKPDVMISVSNILLTHKNNYSQNKLYTIFKKVDKNHEGYLDKYEYKEFLKLLFI